MTKLAVTFPDVERLIRDLLEELITPHEPDVTVGIGVPTDWTPTSPEHLQVVSDGIPERTQPIVAHATVRLVARAASTSRAKAIAALGEGLLLAHKGGGGVSVIRPLAGVLPARDPDTRAEIASVSLRVSVRSQPIPEGS